MREENQPVPEIEYDWKRLLFQGVSVPGHGHWQLLRAQADPPEATAEVA